MPIDLDRLRDVRVFAVIRAPSADGAIAAVDALVRGGVTGIEITYSTPEVARVLTAVGSATATPCCSAPERCARPIRRARPRRPARSSSSPPASTTSVVAAMLATGATTMAGALTPTEVMRAEKLGVHVVKVFPAALGGPPT